MKHPNPSGNSDISELDALIIAAHVHRLTGEALAGSRHPAEAIWASWHEMAPVISALCKGPVGSWPSVGVAA